jgi:hypothetical protein
MKKVNPVKIRNKNLHKAFIKILLGCPVTNIRFSKNRISLDFFGHRISDKIVVRRENHIGEWSKKKREIFIDRCFGEKEMKKSFRALCVHEVIERFLSKTYGLKIWEEAHVVACKKEREYFDSVKGNWKSHEMKVFWDWHKLGEH